MRIPTNVKTLLQLGVFATLAALLAESGSPAAACLLCEAGQVEPFLNLGQTALANKFLAQEELTRREPFFPLVVGYCRACSHVQLTERVPPSAMFEDYLYVSSASDTLKDHLFELSDVVVERRGLGNDDLVIDIGANDGPWVRWTACSATTAGAWSTWSGSRSITVSYAPSSSARARVRYGRASRSCSSASARPASTSSTPRRSPKSPYGP